MTEDKELASLFTGIEEAKDKEIGSGLKPENRPRGILSKADREYLCGLKDYAHAQSEANRKQDIRERIENALKDFTYLWLLLDEEERALALSQIGDEAVTESFVSIVTFIYLSLNADLTRLEGIIEDGVLVGANFDTSGRWAGKATEADVDIDVDYDPDVEVLSQKLEEGKIDQLTPAEIGVLARAGKIEEQHLSQIEESEPSFTALSNIDGSTDHDASG